MALLSTGSWAPRTVGETARREPDPEPEVSSPDTALVEAWRPHSPGPAWQSLSGSPPTSRDHQDREGASGSTVMSVCPVKDSCHCSQVCRLPWPLPSWHKSGQMPKAPSTERVPQPPRPCPGLSPTSWLPPGGTSIRRRCSVAVSHPSPLRTVAHHPRWLQRQDTGCHCPDIMNSARGWGMGLEMAHAQRHHPAPHQVQLGLGSGQ